MSQGILGDLRVTVLCIDALDAVRLEWTRVSSFWEGGSEDMSLEL